MLMTEPARMLTRSHTARRRGMRDGPRHRDTRWDRRRTGMKLAHHTTQMRRVPITGRLSIRLIHGWKMTCQDGMNARQVRGIVMRQRADDAQLVGMPCRSTEVFGEFD